MKIFNDAAAALESAADRALSSDQFGILVAIAVAVAVYLMLNDNDNHQ